MEFGPFAKTTYKHAIEKKEIKQYLCKQESSGKVYYLFGKDYEKYKQHCSFNSSEKKQLSYFVHHLHIGSDNRTVNNCNRHGKYGVEKLWRNFDLVSHPQLVNIIEEGIDKYSTYIYQAAYNKP